MNILFINSTFINVYSSTQIINKILIPNLYQHKLSNEKKSTSFSWYNPKKKKKKKFRKVEVAFPMNEVIHLAICFDLISLKEDIVIGGKACPSICSLCLNYDA